MRCCKTLPRCPARRPLQLSKEDSLGKLHDMCFFGHAKLHCGGGAAPSPAPPPAFNCWAFSFHSFHSFIDSFIMSSFFLSFLFAFHVILLFVWLFLLITASNGILFFPLHVWVRYFCFFLITLKYVLFVDALYVFLLIPRPSQWNIALPSARLGSVYFCCFLNTLKYMYLLIHFFVDPPLVTIEYCSSLCTLGCVYFFKIHFCFFLDPLKYIYVLIHFYLYLIPRPLWTARPEGP